MTIWSALAGFLSWLAGVAWPYLEKALLFIAGEEYAKTYRKLEEARADATAAQSRLEDDRKVNDMPDGAAADELRRLAGDK